jgi:hypothetical protein
MTPDARIEEALREIVVWINRGTHVDGERVTLESILRSLVEDTERRVREEAVERIRRLSRVKNYWYNLGITDAAAVAATPFAPTVTPPLNSNPPDVTIQPPREARSLPTESQSTVMQAAPQPNQLTPAEINQIGSAPQEDKP